MAPKVKVTRNEIIQTALELIRKNGQDSINARNIALALGCSTQPIFSNFSSMEELDEALLGAAYEVYLSFLSSEVKGGKYPQYKAFGMAYIRFASEEKELFKLLFMRDRKGEDLSPSSDFSDSVEMIMKSIGVDKEEASLIHLEMWACVHGIGTMLATSFMDLEWELISNILSDVYQGICLRRRKTEER